MYTYIYILGSFHLLFDYPIIALFLQFIRWLRHAAFKQVEGDSYAFTIALHEVSSAKRAACVSFSLGFLRSVGSNVRALASSSALKISRLGCTGTGGICGVSSWYVEQVKCSKDPRAAHSK